VLPCPTSPVILHTQTVHQNQYIDGEERGELERIVWWCWRMTNKKKILIIDDERITVELAQVLLERYDFEVVCAYDGVEGLKVARAEKPDLILLDIVLPRKDGFEVCEELRSDPNFKDVRIVMFTAKGLAEDIERGRQVGADEYVIKPLSGKNLLVVIKKQLGL